MRRTAIAAALTLVTLLAGACSDEEPPPATTTTTLPGGAIADLVPGDCLLELPDASSGRAEVVDCSAEHRAEVFAVLDLDDGPYPGSAAVTETAALGCAGRYEQYAGEPIDPTTARAFAELVPTPESWEDGDRRTVCLALPPGGRLETGSISAGASA